MTREVRIGGRIVGDGAPCFVTFEAGATHAGVDSAKRLVDIAASAGADAIKFQILDPDRLVADRAQPFSYQVLVDRASGARETVTEPLYDLLKRRALDADQWRAVKAHADRLGLAFFATAGFPEEVDMLAAMGCDSIKIASADIDHFPLIRHAARTGLCLQIDTGSATLMIEPGDGSVTKASLLARDSLDPARPRHRWSRRCWYWRAPYSGRTPGHR